jgi:hypothetical protein
MLARVQQHGKPGKMEGSEGAAPATTSPGDVRPLSLISFKIVMGIERKIRVTDALAMVRK